MVTLRRLCILAGCAAILTTSAQESVSDYSRDPAATRALVERASSIRSGDSKASVLAKLGAPDDDSLMMRKERPEVVGRSMTYDIVRAKRGLVNQFYDQYVIVFLDPNDVVKTITIRAVLGK